MGRLMEGLERAGKCTLCICLFLVAAELPAQGQERPFSIQAVDEATVAAYERLRGEWDFKELVPKNALTKVPVVHFDALPVSQLPQVNVLFGVSLLGSADDASLQFLVHLRNLTFVDLSHSPLTDVGIRDLVRFPNLKSVNLGGTKITDRGMKQLAQLKNLWTLDIGGTNVSDAGLRELVGLKVLTSLDLFGLRISDPGLDVLGRLERLSRLTMGGEHVTDATLARLASLKNLEFLYIEQANITDAGLKQLAALKKLKVLQLELNMELTDGGVAELRRALPNCEITEAGRLMFQSPNPFPIPIPPR
jgi:hypothetical protein